MTLTRGCWRSTIGLLLLVACNHSEPFSEIGHQQDGSFAPVVPTRLTYNGGSDLTPATGPGGGGRLLYAFGGPEIPGGDQCLAVLPVAGGTRTELCARSAGSRDSTDRWEEPAWLDSSRIAYVRAARRVAAPRDDYVSLGTAPLADPAQYTSLVRFPYIAATGLNHLGAAYLTPMADGRVAFVAMTYLFVSTLSATVGSDVLIVDPLSGSRELLPGIAFCSGLSAGPNPGELVFTLADDNVAYLRTADGVISPLHAFSGIARDVQYSAGRLAAVVGGPVFVPHTVEGYPIQMDEGGFVEVVDVASGASVLSAPLGTLVRRPSLTPDGKAVLVQTATSSPDIYRIDLP